MNMGESKYKRNKRETAFKKAKALEAQREANEIAKKQRIEKGEDTHILDSSGKIIKIIKTKHND